MAAADVHNKDEDNLIDDDEAPLETSDESPAREEAEEEPRADATESTEDFVENINFRFQRLYGNVTLLILVIWLAMVISAWLTIDHGWTIALIGIGSALLGLFALRATVHLRSKPLLTEVESFQSQRDLSLDDLIKTASTMSPPADFFVSLVDGPMARQRRQRQTKVTDDA